MPNFRRGVEHIEKANESKGGGDFKPFMPNLYWKDDGQERYVLILNPIDTIPMVKMQKPYANGRVELVVARTDEAIGERKDPLEEIWGYPATDLNVCIAVELEPEFELVKGRKRPTGFVVKTRTFNRKIRDDKGEDTGEKEEVTAPVIGSIAQSPSNFFNHVASQDANKAPVHETPALIRRVGDDKNTDYEFELFDHLELDLSGLIDNIENFSYVGKDLDDLAEALGDTEDEIEIANIIGSFLLDKWLDEISDADYYQEIFDAVDTVARYPKKGWKKPGSKGKDEEREEPVRQTKRSQRKAKQEEAEEAPATGDNADDAEAAEADEPQEEQPKAKRSRAKAKPAEEPEADDAPAEEPVSKESPVRARLAALKAKAEAAKAESAA